MKTLRLSFERLEARDVPSANSPPAGYDYNRIGSKSDLAVASTALGGGLALEGGGTDVTRVYTWMSEHAGHGDFLMIGATGSGNYYNNYVNKMMDSAHKLNSIATLGVSTTVAANYSATVDAINKAEAIFILGGDQSNYVSAWQNSAMTAAINAAAARGVPVGGTSAGLAVLGQYAYSAQYTVSAESKTVLQNPYDPSVTLVKDFLKLPYLSNTITDTHFYERDRMGRLVTFMGRIATDYHEATVHGIGVDEQTALLIETKGTAAGTATIVANASTDPNARHVYFLESPTSPPTQCIAGKPLLYSGIMVQRGSATPAGGTPINLAQMWVSIQTTPDYLLSAEMSADGATAVLVAKKKTGQVVSIY